MLSSRSIAITLIWLACSASGSAGQTTSASPTLPAIPAWSSPAPRLKAKTPFAPKPTEGDNIFKGEAETWLVNAILKQLGGSIDPITDTEISNYVAKIGQHLVAHSAGPARRFEFIVLDDSEENAFSIGGGKVYVNLGLLQAAESEDELAAVIAHEIAHDLFGHSPKTITRQLFWMKGVRKVKSEKEVEDALMSLIEAYEKNLFASIGESLLGWSRNDELQADKAGFYNMYKAGYNPEAMKNVFRRFLEHAKESSGENYTSEYLFTLLFGSHPPSSQRVTALKWESNWIKMPPKDEQFKNGTFEAIRKRSKLLLSRRP